MEQIRCITLPDDSVVISGVDFDLLVKAQSSAQTIETEKDALYQALEELCFLKTIKDAVGKTSEYSKRQPKAWEAAFQVITTLETNLHEQQNR